MELVESVAFGIEVASWLIAKIDDLIVRIIGLGLLLVVAAYAWSNRQQLLAPKLSADADPSQIVFPPSRLLYLTKLGAGLAASGALLFGAYSLDELDQGAFTWPDTPAGRPEAGGTAQPGSDGATSAALPSPVPGPALLARWVQVVPAEPACSLPPWLPAAEIADAPLPDRCGFGFLVRTVLSPEANCPTVKVRYGAAVGAGAGLHSLVLRERRNPDVERYPVLVCEATLVDPERARSVTFADGGSIALSTRLHADSGPELLAIFGDTGCRDDRDQDCSGANWPFAHLAEDVAGQENGSGRGTPDLVIHLGDFIYGGGDFWAAWQYEFFRPAKPLLEAAPWIMVRGNHEGCGGDAPRGWLLFFDYRPGDGGTDTCASTDRAHLVPSYALDLPNGRRLIVTDSSNAFAAERARALGSNCGSIGSEEAQNSESRLDPKDQPGCERFTRQFEHVEYLASDTGLDWLITHVPVFAVEKAHEAKWAPKSSAMMLAASRSVGADGETGVDLVLSGDRHLLQIVQPEEIDVAQVTIGTGGVNLDPVPGQLKGTEQSMGSWDVCTDARHGMVWATLTAGNYRFAFQPLGPSAGGDCDEMLADIRDR
ncbi:metallophosphoesterase [Pelagibius sp.]|uniref:metallophosphoesterase n=1 Tax=Pelagibius sp. TaxID=1931238 RepID=UPI002613C346|nr:metallophosphoesterase [Pelagibius sp.]